MVTLGRDSAPLSRRRSSGSRRRSPARSAGPARPSSSSRPTRSSRCRTRRATTSPSTRPRRRSAGARSAQPHTFSFTTPTVKLLRTRRYRRGGRADAPFVVLLRFNQPVDPAEVAAHLSARFEPHDWDAAVVPRRPSSSGWRPIDPTSLARFNAKVAATRAAAVEPAPVTLRLTNDWDKKRFPPSRTRSWRSRRSRACRSQSWVQAHARRGAAVAGRAGDARPRPGLHDEGRAGVLRLRVSTARPRAIPTPGTRSTCALQCKVIGLRQGVCG